MAQSPPPVPRLTRAELVEIVGRLPRVRIAHLPTPLEEAPRLQEALGPNAPRILIKRDDLTGFALGGNKVRHMEFRMGDIRAKGADSLVVTNVAQSNHARLHSSLAARFGLGVRALQRLFAEYVGVSPKWVIQRYRLHEAAERIARMRPEELDGAALAADLGYADQAHFIRDFRRWVGFTPAEYARRFFAI